MNKLLLTSALVASFLLVVSADDQVSSQMATDQEEVAQLTDKSALFGDFCISMRDYIRDDLRTKGKSLVPTTVLDLLEDTSNRHRNIRARLDSIMNNPGAELKKLDNYVVEQQRSLGQRFQEQPFQASVLFEKARDFGHQAREGFRGFLKDPSRHLQRLDGVLAEQQKNLAQRMQANPIQPGTFFKNAYENLHSMANRLRNAPMTLINETCEAFEQYQKELEKRFEVAKEQLKAQDPNVANLKLEDIQCATIERVNTVRLSCLDLKA